MSNGKSIIHYTCLKYGSLMVDEEVVDKPLRNKFVDMINMEELEEVLQRTKTRKAT